MKRSHVHITVNNLSESILFYTAMLAAEPIVTKPTFGGDTTIPVKTEPACCAPDMGGKCQ